MRNFLFAFIFFLSCSSYNTRSQTAVTITQQAITDSINDASVASFNFLVENYDHRIVAKIMELYDSGNCILFNDFARSINEIQCYIIALNRIQERDDFIIFLSVSNDLMIRILDLWPYVFEDEAIVEIVRSRELIRRYVDNNNITLINVNISCNNETLPILECDKI